MRAIGLPRIRRIDRQQHCAGNAVDTRQWRVSMATGSGSGTFLQRDIPCPHLLGVCCLSRFAQDTTSLVSHDCAPQGAIGAYLKAHTVPCLSPSPITGATATEVSTFAVQFSLPVRNSYPATRKLPHTTTSS